MVVFLIPRRPSLTQNEPAEPFGMTRAHALVRTTMNDNWRLYRNVENIQIMLGIVNMLVLDTIKNRKVSMEIVGEWRDLWNPIKRSEIQPVINSLIYQLSGFRDPRFCGFEAQYQFKRVSEGPMDPKFFQCVTRSNLDQLTKFWRDRLSGSKAIYFWRIWPTMRRRIII